MVYALVADVDARYEGTLPATPYVQALLDEAHLILAAIAPTLDARVVAGDPSAALVKLAIVRAVLRVVRNPHGYSGEHAGDYGYYYRQGEGGGTGQIEFLASDLRLLGIGSVKRAGTITVALPAHRQAPSYPDGESDTGWVQA